MATEQQVVPPENPSANSPHCVPVYDPAVSDAFAALQDGDENNNVRCLTLNVLVIQ